MRSLFEYLSANVKPSIIHATDETIKQIVKDKLDRFGHDADLNNIDVSEVTNMGSLFSCDNTDLGLKYKDLNPDISSWDVSNVKHMQFMFWECENFNQNISKWDVSKVKDMYQMFDGCKSFNQDISKWDVSNCDAMYCMFCGCENFNQDLSRWNVKNVEYHSCMFDNCPIKEEWKPKFK